MNKLLSGLFLASVLGLSVQADALRVEMGGGVWESDLSKGTITSKDLVSYGLASTIDTDTLNYDKEKNLYLWMFIKHPIPILPNLRLEYADVDFTGNTTQDITYKGISYAANADTNSKLEQFDIIMYYNLLDNTAWTTLDLGLDVKIVQSEFNIRGTTPIIGDFLSSDNSETLPIPMLYARARFDLPFGLGVEGIGKYVKYKDSTVVDYVVKADYTLEDVLPIDIGFEVGYRFEKFDVEGDDFSIDTSADIDIDGLFAGAVIRF